jgi:hypothetical protein
VTGGDALPVVPAGEVIEYPRAQDLVPALKAFDASALGPKTSTTISHFPNWLKWTVEVLAGRANRKLEVTVAFLLSEGRPRLWRGADEIRRAREHILAHGGTDDRMWFDACPPMEIALGGTGDRRYVVRLADSLTSATGVLARTLGLPSSQINVLGVMAGLVGAEVVPPTYRPSLAKSLRMYQQLVERRADRARMLVANTPATDSVTSESFWSVDDFEE